MIITTVEVYPVIVKTQSSQMALRTQLDTRVQELPESNMELIKQCH